MPINRSSFDNRVFGVGLPVLLVLALAACVSVEESGNEDVPLPPPITSVSFHARPDFAEVYVDGHFRGTTPVTLHLAAGNHKIEMKLEGFQIWERELLVVAGNDTRVAATLQPE